MIEFYILDKENMQVKKELFEGTFEEFKKNKMVDINVNCIRNIVCKLIENGINLKLDNYNNYSLKVNNFEFKLDDYSLFFISSVFNLFEDKKHCITDVNYWNIQNLKLLVTLDIFKNFKLNNDIIELYNNINSNEITIETKKENYRGIIEHKILRTHKNGYFANYYKYDKIK